MALTIGPFPAPYGQVEPRLPGARFLTRGPSLVAQ
jgi:hypothetical protein